MTDDKLSSKLTQNLLEILNDEEYYDVTIEKNDGILEHVKLPNISPEIFQIILSYIYRGKISLEECDTSDIIKILSAACILSLQELVVYLQSFLIENKTKWMEENFGLIYQTSFENNSYLELQKYCTDLISKEPTKIFKSLNFSSIPEKLLISIIQNDYLQMNEVQIWERVIKWGLAKNPELPSDFTNYSKNDIKILKNTLQQCIPFIRFYNLSSKEFTDNVLPYRKLLPKELYEDLLKTFLNLLDTNSKPNDKSRPRLNNDELSHLPETIDNENTKKQPQLYSESTSSSRYLEQPDEQPDKETAWGSWGPKNSQQSDEESAWDSWKPKNSQQPDEETAWGSWGPKNSQQPDGGSNRKINEASTCGSREPKNFQRPDGGSNRHRPRNSQRPDGGSNRHRPRNSQQFDGGSNRRGGYGRNGPRYSQQPDDEWW
ncbi:BTB/POZ protein [Rhizophagus irregularis DAOM 181602=DAOM 197198]|nr:BTB/POZ protein [Rhizophagus irregularis DAOM 181602=DAOM 197198]